MDQLRGTWHLTGAQVPTGARVPSVTFSEGGAINGNSGVNTFRGTVDVQALQAGRWQAGALATTRMAGTPDAMALEASFLQALAGANEATLKDGLLELKGGGQVLLRLQPLRLR
jgi:heat shock protein HslJ